MKSAHMIIVGLSMALTSITAAAGLTPLRVAETTSPALKEFGGTALELTPLKADVVDEPRVRMPLDANRDAMLQLQRIDVLAPGALLEVACVLQDGSIQSTPMAFPKVDCFQGWTAIYDLKAVDPRDMDGNGLVNVEDLLIVIGAW